MAATFTQEFLDACNGLVWEEERTTVLAGVEYRMGHLRDPETGTNYWLLEINRKLCLVNSPPPHAFQISEEQALYLCDSGTVATKGGFTSMGEELTVKNAPIGVALETIGAAEDAIPVDAAAPN